MDPNEEINYDLYDPQYFAHLHDLKMQYRNKKLQHIILGIPKLLEPNEIDMLAKDDYVLALQVQTIRDQDDLQIRISLRITNLLLTDINMLY